MKILLVFLIIGELFVTIGKAISHLFQPSAKSKVATSVSDSWYGICEKCGRKDGLHRFEGKKYCAMCHARLTAEKNSKQRRMIKMKVNVIRGKNQIGGNIIEISTEKTKILLDAGLELDNDKQDELPDIPELFEYAGYDAIFISHYHGDHLGLVYKAHKDIPVYIGENAYNVIKASDNYKGIETFTPKGFLHHKEEIVIGDITVTPFLCDHSAFDSYMLLCKSGEDSVLYTGDFRSNGRKPFNMLLNSLPKKSTN